MNDFEVTKPLELKSLKEDLLLLADAWVAITEKPPNTSNELEDAHAKGYDSALKLCADDLRIKLSDE